MYSIKSPAKINLGLKVIQKRADNYHDIETLFLMIDLCDEIRLKKISGREGIRIVCNKNEIPTDHSNLAYRAADIFLRQYGIQSGLEIQIIKNIPVAAGLGGGSSNAAATLLGLNALWKVGGSKKDLMRLGARIGADVPFFIFGPAAMGYGRGDILKDVMIKDEFYILLVNPRIKISAAWTYQNLIMDLTNNINAYKMNTFGLDMDIRKIVSQLRNDLEDVVIAKYPMISDIKKKLLELGAIAASMSGSGSTVFGIFKEKQSVLTAYGKWTCPDCDLFITAPVRSMRDIYCF